MPITLSESGNLEHYWYGSRSEKTYKSAAVVGNPRPFSGGDAELFNPADDCQLAFGSTENMKLVMEISLPSLLKVPNGLNMSVLHL